jgi:hypothetical protein
VAHEVARRVLLRRRDRVLEVGDDGVRARRERRAELALVVAGREQERAGVGESDREATLT